MSNSVVSRGNFADYFLRSTERQVLSLSPSSRVCWLEIFRLLFAPEFHECTARAHDRRFVSLLLRSSSDSCFSCSRRGASVSMSDTWHDNWSVLITQDAVQAFGFRRLSSQDLDGSNRFRSSSPPTSGYPFPADEIAFLSWTVSWVVSKFLYSTGSSTSA